jgi:hypothetical protein
MSISYTPEKIKKAAGFVVILVLLPVLGVGVYKMKAEMAEKSPVSIVYSKVGGSAVVTSAAAFSNKNALAPKMDITNLPVVASKKGTKYHLLTCPGAKTIAVENKVTFPNSKAAEKAGFEPAKNCKGLTPISE